VKAARLGRIAARVLLQDPLSASTRRVRNSTLILSLLGIAVFRFDLVPSDYGLLGLRFANPDLVLVKSIVLLTASLVFVEFVAIGSLEVVGRVLEIAEAWTAAAPGDPMNPDEAATRWYRELELAQIGWWKALALVARSTKLALDLLAPIGAFVFALVSYLGMDAAR